MKKFILLTIILVTSAFSALAQKTPLIDELKPISDLPEEIAKGASAIAFDGEKFWVGLHTYTGHYAVYNPQTNEWKISDSEVQHKAIRRLSYPFSYVGGMVFNGNKLWVSGTYGQTFGLINTDNWEVEKVYSQVIRPELQKTNSQSYADITFDGTNIWIAWHLYHYKLPDAEVQQLLKIEPETGKVLEKYPLPIGTKNSGIHGLTFDGTQLWHMKDKRLSAIDLNGRLIAQYSLEDVKNPSGLAWDGNSLWIIEAEGKLWKLPFKSL